MTEPTIALPHEANQDELHHPPAPEAEQRGVVSGRVLLSSLPEGGTQGGRREYACVFMRPGRVKTVVQEPSNWLIPADVIQSHAHLFNSVPCYLDHVAWIEDAPSVRRLSGVTFDTHWSEEEQALVGNIRLYDEDPNSPGAFIGSLVDQILEDQEAGREVPTLGLSATFYQRVEFDENADLWITRAFRHVESIDFVYDAGAGGYVRAALAAFHQQGATPPIERSSVMPNETPQTEVSTETSTGGQQTSQPPTVSPSPPSGGTEGGLSPEEILASINRVSQRVEGIGDAVERLSAVVADQEAERTVAGQGQAPRDNLSIRMGRTGMEQLEAALDAMLAGTSPPNGVQPLTGIRELYMLLSGDYEMTGLFNAERVYLANVNSSTMAALVANRLNKVVVNMFMTYPRWWEPISTPMDFATLQDVRWITLGGIGELPTVTEGAAYTELTWDDNTETATFYKKGGYLGITIESIDKDDTRRLRQAPMALAQAAWLTLGKSVSSIFTAESGVGPDLADSTALFDATRGNLGSTALSHAAYVATRTAMRKQTELNSSERLGALTAPKFLLVPPDLEITALQVLATEHVPGSANYNENPAAQGNMHDERMAAARRRVVVVDLWTDTDNWAAVADPNLYPSIGIGYRYGRTPEIFSVASPTAGLMFSNDVMPVKVRFFFAVGPIDYRGLYKHNV